MEGSLLGTILKGRYLIEKELGRGGIGAVYLARDQQLLSKRVVIKVLLDRPGDDDWIKNKFHQEVEALARIDHPGIVGVLDVGELADARPYFVMQFIEGVTLHSMLKPGGIEFDRVADIVRQMGQALTAAHDRGVYHCDLKPENIMIQTLGGGQQQIKIIDFGIAKVENSELSINTTGKIVAGTVAYMSPEQLMAKPASASNDVFAMGVIAYEMITGMRPFNPDSIFQLLDMHRDGVKTMPREVRPDLPEAAETAILRALSFDSYERYFRARDFGEELHRALSIYYNANEAVTLRISDSGALLDGFKSEPTKTAGMFRKKISASAFRVAILYKRNAQPDEDLLQFLEAELNSLGYEIFIDRHLSIGVEWAREIERQLRNADAVIPLLSTSSINSEMISYEIEIAHESAQQTGKPRLLPVRVNFPDPLPYTLAGILDPIQYALWNSAEDNQRLLAELLKALQSTPSYKTRWAPKKLEPVGGAVPLDSEFYIVRSTDEEFREAIERRDSIVLVKGARQMGKTSLLARGLQQARDAGAKVVLTDFQTLNAAHLKSAETLFQTLAELIADQLDLDVSIDKMWDSHRGPNINFGRFMRRELLGKISSPVVWGLDEVDRLFNCEFGSEVFGLFRSWHNARSLDPMGPWRNLTLAISYATEAHLFITDANQSPFNVGTRLTLEDFTLDQVAELNHQYGSPLEKGAELTRFHKLVSGHPYLVRRGLHELVTREMGIADFESQADLDEGPFGDHLRRMLVLLAQDQALCDILKGMLRGQHCPNPESFYRLRSAGLISGGSTRDAKLRCRLYASYLERHLL